MNSLISNNFDGGTEILVAIAATTTTATTAAAAAADDDAADAAAAGSSALGVHLLAAPSAPGSSLEIHPPPPCVCRVLWYF